MKLSEVRFILKNKQKEICFNEEHHRYMYDQVKMNSVTTLISSFEQPFDPDGSILKDCAEREGIIPEELQMMWTAAGKDACIKGTAIHLHCEKLVWDVESKLDETYSHYEPHIDAFLDWFKKHNSWILLDTEVNLFAEEFGLAGQCDLLAWDWKTNEIVVLDYKTNKRKKMSKENTFKKFMQPPFEHVPDIKFQHYSIQLEVYKLMLKEWGLPVAAKSYIIYFDGEKIVDGMEIMEVDDMSSEASLLVRGHY